MARIVARMGDLFEGASDLTVLPCSAKGTISSAVARWNKLFGVPTPKELGLHLGLGGVSDVLPFPGPLEICKSFCYAASVLNDFSTAEIVKLIGAHIGSITQQRPEIRVVEAPLFGTGAGGLRTEIAFRSLCDGYQSTANDSATLFVPVYDRERYDLLSRIVLDYSLTSSSRSGESPQHHERPERLFMRLAIKLARECKTEPGKDRPSPKVGAVAVLDGESLAGAYRGEPHGDSSGPGDHAEFILLEKKLKDRQLTGATLFTTLEPCTRRGPGKVACADRIIDRRIKRVFIGVLDPDPTVSGLGQMKLQDAGIETVLFDHDLALTITELDREFRRHRKTGREGPQAVATKDQQLVNQLAGIRDHATRMADALPEKKLAMNTLNYQQHLGTVFVAAGNGIQRARTLGAFDDQVDLLNILDGVEQGQYAWQTGNLASDRFHGFWYWTKAHDDPGFDERGDYQPYALKRLAQVIDAALRKRNLK